MKRFFYWITYRAMQHREKIKKYVDTLILVWYYIGVKRRKKYMDVELVKLLEEQRKLEAEIQEKYGRLQKIKKEIELKEHRNEIKL